MAKRRSRRPQRREVKPSFRINNQIRIPEIRLVGDNLDEISEVAGHKVEAGVYPTKNALRWAFAMELDLVEISPKAQPPVCKIINYKKFLYQKKKKEKEIKSKAVKTVVKEIRFGPNTGDHDFDFKLRHAKGFLEDGAKVKAFVHFRGRTIVFKDRGKILLLRFLKELEEYGSPEALPKMEGRRMIVVIAPKKNINKKKKEPKPSQEKEKEETEG
ncbi:MAG: translation initiation factor IF-3 [Bacteroidota bacterium]